MAGIDVDSLAAELAAGLAEYSDSVTEVIKKAVDDVSKSTALELKNTSPKRTGAYAKDWAAKQAYEDRRSKRKPVYNKKH
ncbi:MAG: HK97 gp10 family phage protein, partial [Clostridia bacterium]|nr:HK97 gp10 family phage protein [Clostridia bacterium]